MPKQGMSTMRDDVTDVFQAGAVRDLIVHHKIVPFHTQVASMVPHVERPDFLSAVLHKRPSFGIIDQHWSDAGVVNT